MSDGSGADGGRSAMTAAAPAASACGTKSSPSALPPLTATNRSPGRTVRLSALTPVTSSAAKRASLTASAVRRSASLIVFGSSTFAAPYRPGIAAMRKLGSPRAPREFVIRGSPLSRRGVCLSRAGARQDQLVGRWELKARLKSEQGGDAGNDGTADRDCIPSRRGEAVCVGRRLRFIEHDEEKVARLVGRQDGREGGQDLGFGVSATDHFIGGAGLAADIIPLHIGFGGGAFLDVKPHQIAHLLACLWLDDLGGERQRLGFAALEESRRNKTSSIHQRTDRRHRLQRCHRKPVPERDGHGIELGPALGDEWLGAFRQFGAQSLELTHLPQEPFVVFDPEA